MSEVKRPEPTTEWSGEAYRPNETEAYMDHLEAENAELKRQMYEGGAALEMSKRVKELEGLLYNKGEECRYYAERAEELERLLKLWRGPHESAVELMHLAEETDAALESE